MIERGSLNHKEPPHKAREILGALGTVFRGSSLVVVSEPDDYKAKLLGLEFIKRGWEDLGHQLRRTPSHEE